VTTATPGLVTMGQTLARIRATAVGPFARGCPLQLSVAGAESNTAIAARRLGVPATWIGHVGTDSLGDLILRELRAEGVEVQAVRDMERPTALLLAERRTAARRQIWYYRRDAAGAGLSPADVSRTDWSGAGLLHLTGITACLGPGPAAATTSAATRAKARGMELSIDLNHRFALADETTFAQALRPLVAAADIVFATAAEAAVLTGRSEVEHMAEDLLAAGPSVVVVKFGADGSLLLTKDGLVRQPAIPTVELDPVGAGDAFAGGFLAGRLRGADPVACLRQAAHVAAVAVATEGDWEGLPTEEELPILRDESDIAR
jgi:2-dehydro-3-deoxygluconokinase